MLASKFALFRSSVQQISIYVSAEPSFGSSSSLLLLLPLSNPLFAVCYQRHHGMVALAASPVISDTKKRSNAVIADTSRQINLRLQKKVRSLGFGSDTVVLNGIKATGNPLSHLSEREKSTQTKLPFSNPSSLREFRQACTRPTGWENLSKAVRHF